MGKSKAVAVVTKTDLLKLATDIEALNRRPFKEILAAILGVQPTRQSIQRFANKSPDRWAQALSILGVLAGYERGADVNLNVYTVHGLSDAELLREAGARGVRIIEGEALHVQETPPSTIGVQESDADSSKSKGEITPQAKIAAVESPTAGDTLTLAGEGTHTIYSGPIEAAGAAIGSMPPDTLGTDSDTA